MAKPTDRELVDQARSGDAQAFGVLVRRYQKRIFRLAFHLVRSGAEAEDVTQETFVRAYQALDRFDGRSEPFTWLYRIAVNLCLNRVSAKRLETEPIESDRFEDTSLEDPGAELMRTERAAAVRRAIAALPDKQRAALILRVYHDLSHRQIADVLGSSVGAVKANFFHALGNLKKILGSEP